MHVICGYLLVGGLALVLTGCAVPYYPPPAAVYYPLQPSRINDPVQRAAISVPHADASRGGEQTRAPVVRREHHGTGEQKQARGSDRGRGADKTSGWINPKPLSGS
jgi:hypothetical protein